MWNLEKWYRWTSLQGRNRDTDVENKHMDTKGGKQGGGGMNWEIGIDMYTIICIKWMTNKNLLYKNINKIQFKNSKKSNLWIFISGIFHLILSDCSWPELTETTESKTGDKWDYCMHKDISPNVTCVGKILETWSNH